MSFPRRWITIAEAAEFLAISKKSAYELALRGEISSIKIGRSRRVDLKALEAKLQEQIEDAEILARSK